MAAARRAEGALQEEARHPAGVESPLRAELFSAEQMERHGAVLAKGHHLQPSRHGEQLLRRLADNQRVLEEAREKLAAAAAANRGITPAGEWMLDNFYVIDEQIRTARRHLPKGYSRELPRLAEGVSAGMPRVYDIALEAISHGDGRVDEEGLIRFVAAYQAVQPLALGELWAIPIMLRLALIENLRRVGGCIIVDRRDRDLAEDWADQMMAAASDDPKSVVLVIADMARSEPPLTSPFIAELTRRLSGQSSTLALPLSWIEQWLGESGQTIERKIQTENRHQAADQVSISNSIGSLRFLANTDWREFVETLSVVDRTLRNDPDGTYGLTDFATRDAYRHSVERVARNSDMSEGEVAEQVLELARSAGETHGASHVTAHVGYYLIDDGFAQLAQRTRMRRGLSGWLRHVAAKMPLTLYLGSIALIVALFANGMLHEAWSELGKALNHPGFLLAAIGVLAVVVFSELAIALVNWAATLFASPRQLPRLDYSRGLPNTARSLVAVPTMLGSRDGIDTLVEALEVRFLANRDEHLHFALVTDFLDAPEQHQPGDEELLNHAISRIEQLNRDYAPEQRDRFFLLHRPRLWNPREGVWMGYERKRGKLAALNELIMGGDSTAFSCVIGNTRVLLNARYVITLDSDTQLSRDSAREFIATLAHPLNQAIIDPAKGRVVRGYGILQPRVGTSLSRGVPTRYARLFGSEPGIDPYTRAVSDVYQDLFDEGAFVGKGIYEVATFEQVLGGRFPENRILSHDLLEGCYVRAGLVSDAQLYEDYPARYAADVRRRHRWIRGDWQLIPWLLPWVPRRDGKVETNPLTVLSRWKVLDNLRRSLVPACAVALIASGWLLAAMPAAWTLWALAFLYVPPLAASLVDVFHKPQELPFGTHLRFATDNVRRHFIRLPIVLACLPYEAWYSLDAIVRTLWRTTISRRRLLQWQPSSEVDHSLSNSMLVEWRRMAIAPLFAIGLGTAVYYTHPMALTIAMPILLLWALSPALMGWLGRAIPRRSATLDAEQSRFLGGLSRKTWAFFETFVTADENWLPPDNVQEQPARTIAHRTSPTNIGLYLLANIAARDFGYISAGAAVRRVGDTLATLARMQRYRGHYYNWYDTQTLVPMPPRYVSTVDSGNFAGHLLTLRQALLGLIDEPVFSPRCFDGLLDAVSCLSDALAGDHDAELDAFRHDLEQARTLPPRDLAAGRDLLEAFAQRATGIATALADRDEQVGYWSLALSLQCADLRDDATAFLSPNETSHTSPSLRQLADDGEPNAAGARAQERITDLHRLASEAAQLARFEFDFLYDRHRHLLRIGYNVDEQRGDEGYYDLLASEARLGTFVGIAQGQLPQEAWFALGRLLTESDGEPVLLSWSGSMFEYLMPQLVMPSYPDTLLDQTTLKSVHMQIDYGNHLGLPWGISESGYNAVDARLNYQYRAFGVPTLGLKRGLSQDRVIAPYASMMALMVAPQEACENLRRLVRAGYEGDFGLYEAIDYTASRLPRGQQEAVIRSFMAHHQGMGFLALAYLLLDQPMQRRFEADPQFQATLLLLQERVPRAGAFLPHATDMGSELVVSEGRETRLRVFNTPNTERPAIQMLSNGRYHVMLTAAGGGYSRRHGMAVTRWREDSTRDAWGSFCYLRDVASGDYWSAAGQPTCVPVDQYEAIFSDAKAEFRARRNGYETHMEIAVSPEDDIELRRLRVTNRSRSQRVIEITTYAEVVLAAPIADEMHPAFSNLFVQSELVRSKQSLLCTRRPRGEGDPTPWMFHLIAVHGGDVAEISYETDRARFLGRGNSPANPQVVVDPYRARLSDSEGSVLDPIAAIRVRIALNPEQAVTIDMVTGVSEQRDACLALIDKYRDRRLADRVFDLAWTHSQVVRHQIKASQSDAQLYERLAGVVVYAHPTLRADAAILLQNRRGQSALWGQAISGDLPIVLVQIADPDNIDLVRQVVQAHAYWRIKGLAVDLVIWNEDQVGYRQQLQEQILGLIAASVETNIIDRPGGIFVRPAQQLSNEDRVLLQSVARVILTDRAGTLADQVLRRKPDDLLPPILPMQPHVASSHHALEPLALILENGYGGFTPDGREYVITGAQGSTPAPWSNVIANEQLGCVLSEASLGYSWSENAHELRLTPWHNDPVGDAGGEAIYLRDEESGRIWSPTRLPCDADGEYRVRHGFGYSVFEHVGQGIGCELIVFVDVEAPVKFMRLKLRNLSDVPRRLSITGYVEWVLGDLRARGQMHIVTSVDPEKGVLLASNPFNTEFAGRTAFLDSDALTRSVTGDRNEFLGRNGSMREPAALERVRLSGRTGAGLDPCGAIQAFVELAAGDQHELVFRLGMGRSESDALRVASQQRGLANADAALEKVHVHWHRLLGAVQVTTPDPAINVLANGWLLYQTIACRFVARSGYYQSGGAYGFRDQLQDAMAMVHADAPRLREHLLRCAGHQFPEGDVQHWWHPPQGRGVRTRCSDDYLWLPVAICRYVQCSADTSVLNVKVPYIDGRPVGVDEESYYDLPSRSGLTETLYQHGVRALRRGMRLLGERGLPLIGTGDWNDGMNRVGEHGKGESVWLGFFLHSALRSFSRLATDQADTKFAEECDAAALRIASNLNEHGWDGEWYRRAWFDDGQPLGASGNEECAIDSIAQSWSVLSGVAPGPRAAQAMDSLDRHLVRREHGLIQLLDPPFDEGKPDPGYIRGYVPGVRENGGQYTHAAIWATMAFAQRRDPRAWELFNLINPINHSRDAAQADIYKVEPYVVSADVYAVAPHIGRGGWSWYTGSAGWMYRLIIESLLGIQRRADGVEVNPLLPDEWDGYVIDYRFDSTSHRIEVKRAMPTDIRVGGECETGRSRFIRLTDAAASNVVLVKSTAIEHVGAPSH